MELFLLYIWTRLATIQAVSIMLTIVCFIGILIALIAQGDTYYSNEKKYIKVRKKFVIYFCLFLTMSIITPSQKDAAIILAGWGVLEISRSAPAGRLAKKSLQLIEKTLDEYLKEPVKKEK